MRDLDTLVNFWCPDQCQLSSPRDLKLETCPSRRKLSKHLDLICENKPRYKISSRRNFSHFFHRPSERLTNNKNLFWILQSDFLQPHGNRTTNSFSSMYLRKLQQSVYEIRSLIKGRPKPRFKIIFEFEKILRFIIYSTRQCFLIC